MNTTIKDFGKKAWKATLNLVDAGATLLAENKPLIKYSIGVAAGALAAASIIGFSNSIRNDMASRNVLRAPSNIKTESDPDGIEVLNFYNADTGELVGIFLSDAQNVDNISIAHKVI